MSEYYGRTAESSGAAEDSYNVPDLSPLWNCLGGNPAFAAPESTLEWARASSFDEFRSSLVALNAHLIGADPATHDFSPGVTALIRRDIGQVMYLPPQPPYRNTVLKYAHQGLRQVDSPEAAGEMLATTLLFTQAFGRANKRTARHLYGMGRRAFDDSLATRAAYSAAVLDMEPGMGVNFEALQLMWAHEYADLLAKQRLEAIPEHRAPDRVVGGVRPIPAASEAGYATPDDDDIVRAIEIYLTEPFFDIPFALGLLSVRGERISDFQMEDGWLSASRIIHTGDPTDIHDVLDIGNDMKIRFIQAIVDAYTKPQSLLAYVPDLTAPYWPHRAGA
jgi:hypothetical protein